MTRSLSYFCLFWQTCALNLSHKNKIYSDDGHKTTVLTWNKITEQIIASVILYFSLAVVNYSEEEL